MFKKIAFILAVAASAALASTSVAVCVPAPVSVLGTGSIITTTCSFALPIGAVPLNVQAKYTFDINIDGFSTGSTATDFAFDAPGSDLDYFGSITDATRPAHQTLTAHSNLTAFLSPFDVIQSYGAFSAAVTGATFNEEFRIEYRRGKDDDEGQVPEPASYAMLGAGLIGVAMLRKP